MSSRRPPYYDDDMIIRLLNESPSPPTPRRSLLLNTDPSNLPTNPAKDDLPSMGAFLESPELSDVILQSRDGDRVPAHRLALAAASDVFRTMFGAELREKREGVVEIADMGTKVLKLMLKFIYTGSIKEEAECIQDECQDLEVFLELVRAGDKYHLPLMMKQAGLGLYRLVAKDNALQVFLELKKYGDEMKETRENIAGFIQKNVMAMA